VKRFVLEYCDSDSPDKFNPVFEVEPNQYSQYCSPPALQAVCPGNHVSCPT
jgi:hypothetical protein